MCYTFVRPFGGNDLNSGGIIGENFALIPKITLRTGLTPL